MPITQRQAGNQIGNIQSLPTGLSVTDSGSIQAAMTTKTFTKANGLHGTQTAKPLFSLQVVKNLQICIRNALRRKRIFLFHAGVYMPISYSGIWVRNAQWSGSAVKALSKHRIVPCIYRTWASERNITSPQVHLFHNQAAPATKIPTDTILL